MNQTRDPLVCGAVLPRRRGSRMHTDVHVINLVLLSEFKELEFSRQIFEKCSDIKLHENPSSGSRFVPRRIDRRDGSNSRFSQFSERR